MTTFIPGPQLLNSPRGRTWTSVLPARAVTRRPPAAADVVIVGAGPAGLGLAVALWHRGVRDVVLLDEQGQQCTRFFRRVDVLQQRVMRSPYEHHPGAEGYRECELLDFARLHWAWLTATERREVRMAQAGHRSVVPVDVFEAYCQHLAATHGVAERIWQAHVHEIVLAPDTVVVAADNVQVTARYVALCTGEERRLAPSGWWQEGQPPERVTYWDEPVPGDPGRIAVAGAGLTAAHLVVNALNAGRAVSWVFRAESERYQCSDINAAFFRPEGRSQFESASWSDRAAVMRAQRRASIMYEFRPLLRQAESDGRLTVHRGQAVAEVRKGPTVCLVNGDTVAADHLVLALGTAPSDGQQQLLPAAVTAAADGWPELDERTLAYRQAPRVFAVGAAAGMALGPAARNIDGHRAANGRVATAIAAGLSHA